VLIVYYQIDSPEVHIDSHHFEIFS